MLRKFKWKICTYVSTCCVCIKSFYEKSTYRLAYVKKTNFGAKNKTFYDKCFFFFTPTTCNVVFSRNFTNAYGLWRCTRESFHLNFLTLQNIYIDADLLATRLAVHTTAAVRWWRAHAHRDHILKMPPLACSGLRPSNREWFLFFVYGWPCMHHHVLESFHVVLESFQKLHRLVKFLLYFLESFQKLHCRMPYNRFCFLFRRW
jgi:hypothetical protein